MEKKVSGGNGGRSSGNGKPWKQQARRVGKGEGWIDADEVGRILGLHRDTVKRLSKEGTLPAPIRLGYRTLRWRRAQIERIVQRGLK